MIYGRKFKMVMWYKVQELTQQGLNKSQISRETGLDRATVRKYQKIGEEEFHRWISQPRHLPKKLAEYRVFVKDLLTAKPYLSAAQVEDRLKERYSDMPVVHSKTVYNFVQSIRGAYGIKKETRKNIRDFEKLPEPVWGEEAQADFGEDWMRNAQGRRIKVYFFVILLSRSRYKHVLFRDRPFTSSDAVDGHYRAFEYFQGVPKKIIYDQDRVFIHDENLGDYLLSKEFSDFCKGQSFRVVFCRKSDPQSKGKIESVVKYVKQNFLRGRTFHDIDMLNQEVLAWLERTANTKVHSSTKRIPKKQWEREKKYLLPVKQRSQEARFIEYKVRKDNVFCYKSNFYSLPLGTYKGKESRVLINIQEEELRVFTLDKEYICSHRISPGQGRTIKNTDHKREKSESLAVYKQKVLELFSLTETAKQYFEKFEKVKPRYYRDNLQYILKNFKGYQEDIKEDALLFCMENNIYNSKYLVDILDGKQEDQQKKEQLSHIPSRDISLGEYNYTSKYDEIARSDIDQYENIF